MHYNYLLCLMRVFDSYKRIGSQQFIAYLCGVIQLLYRLLRLNSSFQVRFKVSRKQ